jgi:hypothetical protein
MKELNDLVHSSSEAVIFIALFPWGQVEECPKAFLLNSKYPVIRLFWFFRDSPINAREAH